jgi:8-oxo-dGTP pyrophosphatase MutT (NUDIX family)
MVEINEYRLAADCIILQNNRVLLGKRQGFYKLPGGGIDSRDYNEKQRIDPRLALKRELEEELNLKINIDKLEFIGKQIRYDQAKKNVYDVNYFIIKINADKKINDYCEEDDEQFAFYNINEIPADKILFKLNYKFNPQTFKVEEANLNLKETLKKILSE